MTQPAKREAVPSPYPRHERIVHAFLFHGTPFAYFSRSRDLMRLGAGAFEVLRDWERGGGWFRALRRLQRRRGRECAREVLADVRALRGAGLFEPELSVVQETTDAIIESYLRHNPRNLMFFVTEACNLACTYCYELNQGVHAAARSMTSVNGRRAIDAYLEGTRRLEVAITFFGGEPLLNFALIEQMVAHASRRASELGKSLGFTMTTNLTLLTEEMAEFLARHRFHVMVSIDGDKEGNDRNRLDKRGQSTYETVKANLAVLSAAMQRHGVRLPKLRATLTRENFDPIAVDTSLRSLSPLVEVGDACGTALGRSEGDLDPVRPGVAVQEHIDAFLRELETFGGRPPLSFVVRKALAAVHAELSRGEAHSSANPKLCGVCRNMKAVTPNGDVFPCHRYVGMDAFKIGDREGGVDARRVASYYQDIHATYHVKCSSCWARHLCGGQCPWYLSKDDGSLVAPDDEMCDALRHSFERSLGLYGTLLEEFPDEFRRTVGCEASDVLEHAGASCSTDPGEGKEGRG